MESSYRDILKRIGIVLIVIGALDIGLMIYCITHQMSYSSSVNIFAVIAGIYLLKGNLGAAKAVRFFVMFLFTGAVGSILMVLPLIQPPDLVAVEIRLLRWEVMLPLLILAVIIVAGTWTILEFRKPQVAKAMEEAGGRAWKPRNAVFGGAALVVVLGVLMHFLLRGDAANEAIARAAKMDGPGFKYVVTSMNISNSHVRATVTAYDDNEIRSENVEFDN